MLRKNTTYKCSHILFRSMEQCSCRVLVVLKRDWVKGVRGRFLHYVFHSIDFFKETCIVFSVRSHAQQIVTKRHNISFKYNGVVI